MDISAKVGKTRAILPEFMIHTKLCKSLNLAPLKLKYSYCKIMLLSVKVCAVI